MVVQISMTIKLLVKLTFMRVLILIKIRDYILRFINQFMPVVVIAI